MSSAANRGVIRLGLAVAAAMACAPGNDGTEPEARATSLPLTTSDVRAATTEDAARVVATLRAHRVFGDRIGAGASIVHQAGGYRLGRGRPSAWKTIGAVRLVTDVPEDVRGELRMSVDADFWIGVTPLGLNGVRGAIAENAIVYPNAADGVDLAQILGEDRVEEVRVLRDRASSPRARWSLRAGPAVKDIRVIDGRVIAIDHADRIRIETLPLFAMGGNRVKRVLRPVVARDPQTWSMEVALDDADLRAMALPIALDPVWTATAGSMAVARQWHTATLLPSGSVYVVGQFGGSGSTAELYNPSTGTFSPAGSTLGTFRYNHSATLLSTGQVLIAGGRGSGGDMSTAELFDPVTKTNTATGSMSIPRNKHNGFVLPGGRVLVTGGGSGAGSSNSEKYDPATRTWSAGPVNSFLLYDVGQLPGGKIVAAEYPRASVYDPATDVFTAAPAPLSTAYQWLELTALDATRVMMIGGKDFLNYQVLKTAVLDTATNTWTATAPLPAPRQNHLALLLPNKRVLVLGGEDEALDAIATVDLYDPTTDSWSAGGSMNAPRLYSTATLLSGGRVLVTGGARSSGGVAAPLSSAELYTPFANGVACSAHADCLSGVCADGVCCDRACAGTCEACNAPTAGTCAALTGAPHVGRTCGAYAKCSAGACITSCAADTDCASTHYCVSGACVLRKDTGASCGAARECRSNFCVDGYCCNGACTGQCEACDVLSKEGTCSPSTGKPHGSRAACATSADPTCGLNCDGADRTKCNLGTTTKPCSQNACTSGVETHASYCDGAGKCNDVAKPCGAYACGTTGCKTSCTVKSDCGPGYGCKASVCGALDGLGVTCADSASCSDGLFCTDGICCGVAACAADSACIKGSDGIVSCKKRPGVACTSGSECAAGFCVDGVCCDGACAGQCQACDVEGQKGKCAPVKGAPHGSRAACASAGDGPCAAQRCNGSDPTTCAEFVGAEITCRPAACADGIATKQAVCDGAGKCPALVTDACQGFACDPTTLACKTTCSGTADCVPGYVCEKGACKIKTASCSVDGSDLVAGDGTKSSCAPYVCSEDRCLTECATTTNCAVGFACDVATKTCVKLEAAPPAESGGCSVSRGGSSAPALFLIAFATILASRRRKVSVGLTAVLALFSFVRDARSGFTPVANMSTSRSSHGAARLANGKILLVGGFASTTLATTEQFDPTTSTFSAAAPLTQGRYGHITSILPDGRVLAAGGQSAFGAYLSSSEVYNPSTNTWSPTGSLTSIRDNWEYITLTGGRVLVAGAGVTGSSTAELFNPATMTWEVCGANLARRADGMLAALPSGKALFAGGFIPGSTSLSTAELLDPATRLWTSTGSMSAPRARAGVATLLDGRVLVAGGSNSSGTLSTAELYNPTTGTWSAAAPMRAKRSYTVLTTLPSGRVLLTGGARGLVFISDAEIYDPTRNAWLPLPNMQIGRINHTVTVTSSGSALVAGGSNGYSTNKAELYVASALGATCTAAGECASGYCTEGVCCSSAACGAGASCAISGSAGTCKKVAGVACASSTECGSGFCADGLCCNTACTGQCEACDLVASPGVCSPVSGPTRGARPLCSDGGGDVCKAMACDGSDRTACHYRAAGVTPCGKNECVAGVETHASTCDGTGKCADVPKSCGDFACGTTACKTSCTSAADCVGAGRYCRAGVCTPLETLGKVCADASACQAGLFCVDGVCCGTATCATGATCSAPGHEGTCVAKAGSKCTLGLECASGTCADGRCCDRACDGQCEACDIAGLEGKCTPVKGAPSGGRPACAGGADACSTKLCDGVTTATCAGFVGGEVACRVASCTAGKATAAASCDGMGACPATVVTSCGGFLCDPTTKACKTACAAASDCAEGYECQSGACKPTIATCSEDASTVLLQGGEFTRCYPLRCRAGACLTQCTATDDCAGSFVCDVASKTCVPGAAAPAADDGGCTQAPSRSRAPSIILVGVALAISLSVVRRRRWR